MPATSKAQWSYMKAIAAGHVESDTLSPEDAAEFIEAQPTPKGLPKRVKKEKRAMFETAFGAELGSRY